MGECSAEGISLCSHACSLCPLLSDEAAWILSLNSFSLQVRRKIVHRNKLNAAVISARCNHNKFWLAAVQVVSLLTYSLFAKFVYPKLEPRNLEHLFPWQQCHKGSFWVSHGNFWGFQECLEVKGNIQLDLNGFSFHLKLWNWDFRFPEWKNSPLREHLTIPPAVAPLWGQVRILKLTQTWKCE